MFAEPPPALAWGTPEPLRLEAADGQEFGAWLIPGEPGRPAVVLLHGHGGCRSCCLKEAELCASAGSPVLLVSLRAHGDSPGDVNDFGYSARHDVSAAVAWLGERRPKQRVIVWGQSMGAAAALFAAKEAGDRVAGYILESPYRDLWTAVRNRTSLYLPPVADHLAYAGLALMGPLVLANTDRISPIKACEGVPESARVLILVGGADTKARPEEAEAIAGLLGKRAELVIFPGAGHGGLRSSDPERYRATVLAFLGAMNVTSPP
jgi:pimeloyl-ACP methyl ester carboxylesterase